MKAQVSEQLHLVLDNLVQKRIAALQVWFCNSEKLHLVNITVSASAMGFPTPSFLPRLAVSFACAANKRHATFENWCTR
jgi:hypothetical protein